MAGIFNLIYVMILFLSLFIILTNGDGKHFLKFHTNLIHNISFTFYTNIALYLFHIIDKCDTDDDCRDYSCSHPTVAKCIYNYCHCIVMITIE